MSRRFNDLSLQRKLIVVIMSTSLGVLFMALSAQTIQLSLHFQQRLEHELKTLAGVVGANCAAPLMFDDTAAATEVLQALAEEPHIVAADLLSAEGELFARYERPASVARRDELLSLRSAITLDGETLGSLEVWSDSDELYAERRQIARTALLVLVGSFPLALLMSAPLRRRVSTPIQKLMEAAGRITGHEDFGIRVEVTGGDEVGRLGRSFNTMLERLDLRDQALCRVQRELETQIERLEAEALERRRAESALKKSEEALREAQKMEAVGLLAGGIAHDFNNQLTAILGFTELALSRTEEGSELRSDLEEIRQASKHSASLTSQLLAIGRKQVLNTRVLDLNRVIDDRRELLRRLLRTDIELIMRLDPEIDSVLADPTRLEQILLNLVVNARDAMPRGGTLSVETGMARCVPPAESWSSGDEIVPRRCVVLTVRDTGHGMDRATRQRIFEPFFTTKARQKGTGLGLSTVYGVVKQSGGQIRVESAPGEGTTFEVYLPAIHAIPEMETTAMSEDGDYRGSETILVVEDEPQVRVITSKALRALGYNVLEANGPDEAMEFSQSFEGTIDLLLTDVIMPKMNGRELRERLYAALPGLRTVYMSGYTGSIIGDCDLRKEGIAFIQKPFTKSQLGARVRGALQAEV